MNNSSFPTPASLFRGRCVLEWLAMACLLASPLVGPVLLGGSRLWASGPLMALVFLATLLVFLRLLIWRDEAAPLRVPPGVLAWLGFLAFSTMAIWVYDTPYEARVELLRAASLWAAYWAWANLVERGNRWRWVLGLILLAASVNALYGLVNYFQGTPERVLWFDRNAEGATGYETRISGSYFCPNHWASLLAMLAPVALALVCTPAAGGVLRLLAGYVLLTFVPAIHVSQSRAGLIGLAAGTGVTVLALVWRRSRIWFAMLLVALPLLLAGGAVAYWEYSPTIRTRFAEAFQEGRTGNGFRLNQWRDTILIIKDRPWFGHGPGSYGWVAEAYRTHMKDPSHQAFYAHNDYLQSLAEVGVVGTALLALPLLWLLLRLLRVLPRTKNLNNAGLVAGLLGAWVAMLAHAVFDFNLRIYANVAVLALLSGVVAGRLFVRRDWDSLSVTNAIPTRVIIGTGLAMMLALCSAMVWTLYSYYNGIQANRYLQQFAYSQAEQAAKQALQVDSGNWYAAETLGRITKVRGRWTQDEQQRRADAAESVHWFELAAQGNRLNMETRFDWGLGLLAVGQVEEGLRLLRQAADTHPFNTTFRPQLGLQLRLLKRYPEALAEFQKALRVQNDPMIHANIQWLETNLK